MPGKMGKDAEKTNRASLEDALKKCGTEPGMGEYGIEPMVAHIELPADRGRERHGRNHLAHQHSLLALLAQLDGPCISRTRC